MSIETDLMMARDLAERMIENAKNLLQDNVPANQITKSLMNDGMGIIASKGISRDAIERIGSKALALYVIMSRQPENSVK